MEDHAVRPIHGVDSDGCAGVRPPSCDLWTPRIVYSLNSLPISSRVQNTAEDYQEQQIAKQRRGVRRGFLAVEIDDEE